VNEAADPEAFPVSAAVIVPAAKLPLASLLTIVEAVFTDVAACTSSIEVAAAADSENCDPVSAT
jgi:hypothetical protein